MSKKTYCGFIAIIGRPNVGKSTLLNKMMGQKISITSRKPQTTRHRILGIKTEGDKQAIFVDTPGLHPDPKRLINRVMIQTALDAIHDVDAVIFMVDANYWTVEDDYILEKLKKLTCPIILVLNKVDKIKNKDELLPTLKDIAEKIKLANISITKIFPLSATKGDNVTTLENLIFTYLPPSPFLYAAEDVTDRSEKFLAAELIREKLMRAFGQEVPHTLTVEIEEFKLKEKILHVGAIIWVERKGQKIIVVGHKGERLKEIGKQARLDMEKQFGHKVFLRLWVKVKAGWTDDQRALKNLGYGG